jgi:heme oxygenase (biliverdin-IX-beta and delta-forming)
VISAAAINKLKSRLAMIPAAGISRDILLELRDSTRGAHEALERRLDWTAICSSHKGYSEVLARFYGFVRPWESVLRERAAALGLESAFEARYKNHLLEDDLRVMGFDSDQIDRIERMSLSAFPQKSHAQLLGAAYVMEGSTLGGQMISRLVADKLKLESGAGTSYFASYGSRVGSMWKEFGEVLRQRVYGEEDQRTAIEAATQMFTLIDAWLAGVQR